MLVHAAAAGPPSQVEISPPAFCSHRLVCGLPPSGINSAPLFWGPGVDFGFAESRHGLVAHCGALLCVLVVSLQTGCCADCCWNWIVIGFSFKEYLHLLLS